MMLHNDNNKIIFYIILWTFLRTPPWGTLEVIGRTLVWKPLA